MIRIMGARFWVGGIYGPRRRGRGGTRWVLTAVETGLQSNRDEVLWEVGVGSGSTWWERRKFFTQGGRKADKQGLVPFPALLWLEGCPWVSPGLLRPHLMGTMGRGFPQESQINGRHAKGGPVNRLDLGNTLRNFNFKNLGFQKNLVLDQIPCWTCKVVAAPPRPA